MTVDAQTRAEEVALAAYPQLKRLIDMRAVGWRFSVVHGGGSVTQVKGIYLWHTRSLPWADMFQIRNINDVAAIRLTPLKEMVWKYEGGMTGAIDALLELPHPDEPNAPRLVIATVQGLWLP